MDQAQCTPCTPYTSSGIDSRPNGSEIRTQPEITAHFSMHSRRQIVLVSHTKSNEFFELSIEELESVLRYAKAERARQKKEAVKSTKANLKYIQSL